MGFDLNTETNFIKHLFSGCGILLMHFRHLKLLFSCKTICLHSVHIKDIHGSASSTYLRFACKMTVACFVKKMSIMILVNFLGGSIMTSKRHVGEETSMYSFPKFLISSILCSSATFLFCFPSFFCVYSCVEVMCINKVTER